MFEFSEITRALGVGPVPGPGIGSARGVSIDSRTLREGDLYVAIRGKRFDGNEFAGEALDRGAAGVVVERFPASGKTGRPVWRVRDTLEALGKLARFHRDRFRPDLAAITGSCGKSTTKSMLAHVLSGDRELLATPGTQNNRVGVPLTLFQLHAGHRVVVLELGTNQWGEIRALTEICRPTLGAVTNIGPAHLETFGDLNGVLKAKGELWEGMDPSAPLVLNADDPLLVRAGRGLRRKVLWFGTGPGAGLRGEEILLNPSGSSCRVNGRWEMNLPVPGRHNVMNALAALACAEVLGMELGRAVERLGLFAPLPGRLNQEERGGVLFLDDSYNANPASLSAALEVMEGIRRPSGRKVVLLGDMLELGTESESLHAEAGRQIARRRADALVTVGRLARRALAAALEEGLPAGAGRAFEAPEQAGEFLAGFLRPGDLLLLKGSRGVQLERALACFSISSIH